MTNDDRLQRGPRTATLDPENPRNDRSRQAGKPLRESRRAESSRALQIGSHSRSHLVIGSFLERDPIRSDPNTQGRTRRIESFWELLTRASQTHSWPKAAE